MVAWVFRLFEKITVHLHIYMHENDYIYFIHFRLADVPTIHGFTMYSRMQGSLKRRVGIRVLCKDSTFVVC